MKYLISLFLILTSHLALAANPSVTIDTNKGAIVIELYQDKAPVSVKNFLRYVEHDQFANTTFHRVIKNFMVQGGGFSTNGKRLETFAPIQNEANNGLTNDKGTIAMARTSNPNSATRQFFINHVDNDFLNYNSRQAGYAVFGKVTSGMEVVEQIAAVKTASRDKPVETVLINKITINPVNEVQ